MRRGSPSPPSRGGVITGNLIPFVAFSFLLVITPGPSTAVIVRNALEAGRGAALVTAVGIAIGNATYAAGAALGLTAVVARSPEALEIIRLAGAAFLVLLGMQSLRQAWRARHGAPTALDQALAPQGRPGQAGRHTFLVQGILTNLLNPAAAVFYLSYVPQFVGPAESFRTTFLALSAIHVGLALAWHSVYAVTLGRLASAFAGPRGRWLVPAISGAMLALLGVTVALI